ncbi:MAG: S46 family peptidase [Candidatus Acidiferrales bacterium]
MYLSRGLIGGAVLMGAVVVAASMAAVADEGMWTFDNPPVKLLQQNYGFVPTQGWLDHVRLSSVRLNDGGSGSFVSPDGLLLTNHHVARGQLQKNSTPEHDYIANGFYAATKDQEMKSPDLEVNVLVSMENVTARVQAAGTPAMTSEAALKARQAVSAAIESESLKATGLRSDVISLYQGGEYWLYRYKKYTDVRIVFAPEEQAAFFGGDPDNFTYPRYDLDMALFRVYENGKPVHTVNYLKWNPKGPAENELVFVSGNPGSTQRDDTVAQLTLERDVIEPNLLKLLHHRIGVLREYGAQGTEQARESETQIFFLENSRKAFEGRLQGLLDPGVFGKKRSEETEFRDKVAAHPQWQKEYGGAWAQIEEATQKYGAFYKEDLFRRTDSPLFATALSLVQYAAEVAKPDGERLAGYHDSQMESLKYSLLSPAPVYANMETARMAGSLQQALAELGPNDPWVETALDGKTPAEAAHSYIGGSKLADPGVRRQLLEGGESAIAASTDPLIALAKRLDPLQRAMVKRMDEEVKSVDTSAGERLGKARFLVYGKDAYPDATFTLRLSYGTASGYPMNGTKAPYKTTYYGLYDRSAGFDGQPPFNLPQRYLDGRTKLNLATPLDFVATVDIIGGNSGSPVFDRNGELVGLIFDGNIESLAGDFVYDGTLNRGVAVDSAAMLEALRKLYGAGKLADELEGK